MERKGKYSVSRHHAQITYKNESPKESDGPCRSIRREGSGWGCAATKRKSSEGEILSARGAITKNQGKKKNGGSCTRQGGKERCPPASNTEGGGRKTTPSEREGKQIFPLEEAKGRGRYPWKGRGRKEVLGEKRVSLPTSL